MLNFMEWLGGAARSNYRNASVTQHSADHGLTDLDRLDFVQQHFDRLAVHEALLNHDTAGRDGHLRRASTHHTREDRYDAAYQEGDRASLYDMFAGIAKSWVIEEVTQQCT